MTRSVRKPILDKALEDARKMRDRLLTNASSYEKAGYPHLALLTRHEAAALSVVITAAARKDLT